ncbi:ABC transporter permease [Listeria kieliensis]
MIKLMKLEYQKLKFTNFIFSFMGITVGILLLVLLTGMMDGGEEVISTGSELWLSGDLMLRIAFTIYSGVLISQLIVKEFSDRTIQVLFTYPISRKKILASKLLLIMITIFLSVLAAEAIFIGVSSMFNNSLHLTNDILTMNDAVQYFLHNSFLSALTTVGIGLIPLYFGLLKNSTVMTILSAVIISMLLNGNVGSGGIEDNAFSTLLIPVALCLIGLAIAYLSYHKINRKDI